MKKYLLYILISTFVLPASAQEYISADTTRGCDSLTVTFTLENARAVDTYSSITWNFGDGTSSNGGLNKTHHYAGPGIFNVSCYLDVIREVKADFTINVSVSPFADFVFRDSTPQSSELSYIFKPSSFTQVEGIGMNYLWTFPDATQSTDSVSSYTFAEAGVYQVSLIASDENACADTIVKNVPVSKELVIPNFFTPNGDHTNDVFEVFTSGIYNYRFRVFNDQGMQVFSSSSPYIRWEGRAANGSDLPVGVYFITIESDETPVKTKNSAFVHLFR